MTAADYSTTFGLSVKRTGGSMSLIIPEGLKE